MSTITEHAPGADAGTEPAALVCQCTRAFATTQGLAKHVLTCPVVDVYREDGKRVGDRVVRKLRKAAPELLDEPLSRHGRRLFQDAVETLRDGRAWPPASTARPEDHRRDKPMGLRFSTAQLQAMDRAVAAGVADTRSGVVYALLNRLD